MARKNARIAIDYTPAYEQNAGIGRYVRELVSALGREDPHTNYSLFVAGARRSQLPPNPGPNFTWKPTAVSPAWWARFWHRLRLPYMVERIVGPVDLFHATDFVLPPTQRHTRTILTVHDLSFVRVPQAASPALKRYLDHVVPRSIHRADHVLADSEATRQDMIAVYGTPAAKITVLLSGVDQRFHPIYPVPPSLYTKYGIPPDKPFILAVGTVQPRKNYSRLIQALALVRSKYDLHLVIAGGRGWLEDDIYRTIPATSMEEAVHFVGFVEDTDLPALYSAAAALAFPSLYEGFGLPILESMACGTPVVTSNVSSLPEVAGEAALLVDPYNIEALAEALSRVVSDGVLRRELIARGQQQAQFFTWERAARKLMGVYQALLNHSAVL